MWILYKMIYNLFPKIMDVHRITVSVHKATLEDPVSLVAVATKILYNTISSGKYPVV